MGINRLSFVLFLGSLFVVTTCRGTEPIDIGSRLEPFVDDFLIDTIAGDKLTLHQPLLREVVIRHDAPWEGNVSWTHSVIQDGPIYRMYYRGAHAGYQQRRHPAPQLFFATRRATTASTGRSRKWDWWISRNRRRTTSIATTSSPTAWSSPSQIWSAAPDELSIYAIEGYYSANNTCRLRRHTIRMDGFVSMQAPLSGGEFVTKPLVFAGKTLVMNYSTSAAGSVSVELQTPHGKPIDGFSLADCGEICGDQLNRTVAWKGKNDVSKLAGTLVRLHFVLKDADLYSLQFRP